MLGNAGLIRDLWYRTDPDAACRRRIDTVDYRKKCRCRSNLSPIIPAFTRTSRGLQVFLLAFFWSACSTFMQCRAEDRAPSLPYRQPGSAQNNKLSYAAPSKLSCNSLSYVVPFCWATLHTTELRFTLQSYVAPQVSPGKRPTELRCTLLNNAALYGSALDTCELCYTLLSCAAP
jgi:hypothetical protein